MNLALLLGCSFLAAACGICQPREVRGTTTLVIPPGQACPSLEAARKDDTELDRGPAVVDVWIARCCYDVVLSGSGEAAERCEKHPVRSDWDATYLQCASLEYRASRKQYLSDDAGAEAIAAVTAGPRETRTPQERRCVYSKVTGHTQSDTCG